MSDVNVYLNHVHSCIQLPAHI